jgi:hypothetical protein
MLVETYFPSRALLPKRQMTEISPTLQTIYEKTAISYNIGSNRPARYPHVHFPLLPLGSMAGQGYGFPAPTVVPIAVPSRLATSSRWHRHRPRPPLVSRRAVPSSFLGDALI